MQNFNSTFFENLTDINSIKPIDVHAGVWVYLCLSFIWLCSGALMILYVKEKYIKNANFFLYFWVFNTFIISVLDVVFGAFFSKDYSLIAVSIYKFSSLENIV